MFTLLLEVNCSVSENIHGTVVEDWVFRKCGIYNKSVKEGVVEEGIHLDDTVAEEVWNNNVIQDKIDGWLEEFIDQDLNGELQKVCDPSNNVNNEVSRECN